MADKVILTGAAGFVGSHVLAYLLDHTDWEIVCPVTFTHKGVPARLVMAMTEGANALNTERMKRVYIQMVDLTAPVDHITLGVWEGAKYIFNVASDSHVDRSITEPRRAIMNNVALMTTMLDAARIVKPDMFIQMSTDEVYGPAAEGYASREWDAILPSNPYSASKAAQEAIAFSYWRTYDVPVVITNTMNIIGERQDAEKFLPRVVKGLLTKTPIPVHTDENGIAGSRMYLHAMNLADAWLWITQNVKPIKYSEEGVHRPRRINVVGEREIANDELVYEIGAHLDMSRKRIDQLKLVNRVDFHGSRPGHDRRYALDGAYMSALGWDPPLPLNDALGRVTRWYRAYDTWL